MAHLSEEREVLCDLRASGFLMRDQTPCEIIKHNWPACRLGSGLLGCFSSEGALLFHQTSAGLQPGREEPPLGHLTPKALTPPSAGSTQKHSGSGGIQGSGDCSGGSRCEGQEHHRGGWGWQGSQAEGTKHVWKSGPFRGGRAPTAQEVCQVLAGGTVGTAGGVHGACFPEGIPAGALGWCS